MDPVDGALPVLAVQGVDLLHGHAVVEELLLLVPKVAQAIPLRRDLRVERPDVVVARERRLGQQLLVERAPAEEGAASVGGLGVEGPVEGDSS